MSEYDYHPYDDGHSHHGSDYEVTDRGFHGGWGPFYIVSMLASGLALVGMMGAMVLGLLWLSDLSEHYTAQTRRVLRVLNISLVVVHAMVLLVDQLSWWRSLGSILAQGVYFMAMRTFPYVRLASPVCIACVIASVADTVSWYSLLLSAGSPMYYSGFIGGCCWSMPMGLLLSMGLEDEYLPGNTAMRRH
jgi:hypothetical protein